MREKGNGDTRIYTMAEEVPWKAVLKMGLPVTMGMLFMVAYNLVDTYFVGLLHNDYQLATVNLAYPVMMIMIALSGIVGNGGASYIARCIGAGDMQEAKQTLTIGLELTVLISLVLSAAGLVFLRPVAALLGAGDNTMDYTCQYASVLLAGSIFIMGNYAVGQLLRSEGSTMLSMVGMIAGTLANIILDPVFIFLLGMEVRGAAIATVLGNAVGTGIMLFCYAAGKTLLRPSWKLRRIKRSILKEIMLVGIPHTLEQFLATAAIVVNNNLAVGYGELTVAGIGVSNKVLSLGSYVYQGMAAGCQPLMGFNYGAGNYSRMRRLIICGTLETTAMELCVMAAAMGFAPALIGLFTDSPEVIALGAMALRAAALMLPFVGTTSIVRNTFNAMGRPFYAFGITVVRQLVLYIPFLLLFDRLWGFRGLIHAQPAEEAVCMVFAVILLFRVLGMLDRKKKAESALH